MGTALRITLQTNCVHNSFPFHILLEISGRERDVQYKYPDEEALGTLPKSW